MLQAETKVWIQLHRQSIVSGKFVPVFIKKKKEKIEKLQISECK